MKRAYLVLLAIILCVQAYGIAQTKNPAQLSEDKIVKVRPLPLSSVRLTGGPLKHSQDLDTKYLLELQPDRMLAFLRERAGLKPKAAPYGGWDGSGRQLTGHIAGHYLSAVSLAWAATGDPQFKQRVDYIVTELKEIQAAQGDGYIGALMDGNGVDGKVRFQDLSKGVIKSGGFDLNGLWSPWYVEHKIYAGLRDAYRLTGNRTALEVEIKFAAWAESIVNKLNDEQTQRMLNTEFGAMNEVAADLYADTGDQRWLRLSDKFQHHAIIDPLAAKQDILSGKHANTNIPKLYGSLMRYIYTGNQTDGDAAKFFWDRVAKHHSFATGGNSKNEYFGNPDLMNDFIDGRTAETCNVYNMIKMARTLFSIEPDIRYADYHERALFNHILASQDPDDGRVSYMVPVGRGVQHEYQDKDESFTCCVGSALESHALHAYGIYYESGDKLWVSLYAPSTGEWKAEGVKFEMSTDFPIGESASFKVLPKSPKKLTLALRRPYWAGAGFTVKVNGETLKTLPDPDSYVEITRTWKAGDTVQLTLPKTLRKEPLADNPHRVALMWGPLTLAGDLGKEFDWQEWEKLGSKPSSDVPVLVTEQPIENWLKPVAGKAGAFHTVGIGTTSKDVDFVPFYQLPRRKYAIYWDLFTPEEWKQTSATYAAEQEKRKKLEAATVAFAQPGQMQSERDFNQQGEDTTPIQIEGHYGRQAAKWFSFDLPVDASHPMSLIVTYSNETHRNSRFAVIVDGEKLGELKVERRSPELDIRFPEVEYPLSAQLVQQKKKVTVRFEAVDGTSIPGIFGIRTVRTDATR